MLMHEKSRANATIARLFFKECRRISLFGRLVVELSLIHISSVLMLLGPSFLITRIHPATSIRYE